MVGIVAVAQGASGRHRCSCQTGASGRRCWLTNRDVCRLLVAQLGTGASHWCFVYKQELV